MEYETNLSVPRFVRGLNNGRVKWRRIEEEPPPRRLAVGVRGLHATGVPGAVDEPAVPAGLDAYGLYLRFLPEGVVGACQSNPTLLTCSSLV